VPSIVEANEACQTANEAADVYEHAHLGHFLGGLAEFLSRKKISAEAIEEVGLVAVLGAKFCQPFVLLPP
jgi:hypothetical protein